MQKRITYALAALVLAAAPAAAQQKADPKPMSHDMAGMKHDMPMDGWNDEMKMHFEGITLTDDQKTKLVAAFKLHHGAIDKLNATGKKDDATTKAIKQHEDAAHADFKTIIGAENYPKFEANMKKHMAMEKSEAAKKKP